MTTTLTLAIADERVAQAKQTLQVIQAWPHWNEIALCAQKEYTLSPEQFRLGCQNISVSWRSAPYILALA